VKFVSGLLSGQEQINNELAEALSRVVGSSARFWLSREQEYREALARLVTDNHDLEVWASALPLADMRRFGWIRATAGPQLIAECLSFFGVSSRERWHAKYEKAAAASAFRTSAAFDTDPAAVATWLRQGEIQAAQISCADWNPVKLRSALPGIRRLTRMKSPAQFLPELQRVCAAAGVAVVVTAAPAGCRASGAARYLDSGRPVIQLSQRYATDDQFWFTFFHEAGHLILHRRKRFFIDDPESIATHEEYEANEFAASQLLNEKQQGELQKLPTTYVAVIRFARAAGVAPGIVVGQMQHSKRIGFARLNKVRRKLDWDTVDNC